MVFWLMEDLIKIFFKSVSLLSAIRSKISSLIVLEFYPASLDFRKLLNNYKICPLTFSENKVPSPASEFLELVGTMQNTGPFSEPLELCYKHMFIICKLSTLF